MERSGPTRTVPAEAAQPVPGSAETLHAGFPPPERKRHTYTAPERWLLLGAIAIGVAFRLMWTVWTVDARWLYSGFWAVYLAVFLVWQRERIRRNRFAWLVLIPAVLLMALLPLGTDRYAGLEEAALLMLPLFAAIPLLLMLHAVLVVFDVPVRREGMAVLGVVKGFFVLPFTSIGRFFGAIGSLLAGTDDAQRRRGKQLLLGLAVGIPLLIAVLALLSGADARMDALLSDLFRTLDIGACIRTLLVVLATAMLFYSFLHGGRYAPPTLRPLPDAVWSAATLGVIETLLLIAYALFLGLQFSYLFGGTLPEAYTYSEYARAGFGELIAVSLINFTLLALSVRYGTRSPLLRLTEWLLLVSTALLLASAILRLSMYIGAYGLTLLRILAMWLMLFLVGLTALTAVRLVRTRLPLTRIAAVAFLYWYAALYVPNWQALIQSYNALH